MRFMWKSASGIAKGLVAVIPVLDRK
jgi:hypothetical protein